MRTLALTLVPLLLLACAREPTALEVPHLSTDRRSYTEVIPDPVVGYWGGSCGDFDILNDWLGQMRVNSHYDANGNLARREYIYSYLSGTVYNSEHPDIALDTGPGEVQNSHWDLVNGWLVSTGLIVKVVLPGAGPIFMETGAWKVDLATWTWYHDSGHDDLGVMSGQANVAALCAALAP